MRRSDFHYALPDELIATRPADPRPAARLLVLDGDTRRDLHVRDLPGLLRPGDLLVVNDTRVVPARLFARRESGGRAELLVERVISPRLARAFVRASKAIRPGAAFHVEGVAGTVRVVAPDEALWTLRWEGQGSWAELLERVGHVPLPPYIRRADDGADRAAYQTVYARVPGAVAAPTAGLHFDAALLDAVRAAGVGIASVTLHVGAGTFSPVRVDDLAAHRMHAERYTVPDDLPARIVHTRAHGGRVVAVGTTVVRALESAWQAEACAPRAGAGETRLFITPGHRFRAVDALLTNFHLPESTLLMLVCAFGGHAPVLAAYRHAVVAGYRFFSYGDAMFLERRED